jgi:hypothetical protein
MDEQREYHFDEPIVHGNREATEDERWIGVTGGGLLHPISIRVAKSSDGRLVCTGLRIGVGLFGDSDQDVEVTSRSLRHIPLAEILEQLPAAGERFRKLVSVLFPDARPVHELAPHYAPRKRGYRYPDEHYERVAEVYREALRESPGKAYVYICKTLGVSRATAYRHVQTARDKGLLGEATHGRAGERPTIKEQPAEQAATPAKGGQPK